MKPCIVVVGYNRPNCLERILQSVNNAVYKTNDINLVISLDKAENDKGCLDIANKFVWKHGEKIVRTFPERLGLRKHILECGDLTEKYGSVIILEDDLLVSPMFYVYASGALEKYKDDPIVSGISLYSHDWNGYANKFFSPIFDGKQVYLGQFSITWGECWTKEWWGAFKEWYLTHQTLNPKNPNLPVAINKWSEASWGKYFVTYLVEKDLYYVIPDFSLSTNCSLPGQHAKYFDPTHQVKLLETTSFSFEYPDTKYLQKYDVYFENISLKEKCFAKYLNDGLCVDLYGTKQSYKERYVLSTKCLKFKTIKSYGLSLRPLDANVINNFEGDVIHLYDTSIKGKKPKNNKYEIYKYELRGFSLRTLSKYWRKLFKKKVSRKLFKNK